MVYAAFYKGDGDFTDKLVRLKTRSPYSHMELILEDGYMYSISPRENRVRRKVHVWDESKWDYLDIPDADQSLIYEFFKMTENSHYDWFGICGFVIPLQDREDLWFCSEWCTTALKISGCKKLWVVEPSKASPGKAFNILK